MWAIEVVILSKYSFHSCDNESDLFTAIFSDIQKNFACTQIKCKCLEYFKIYFKEFLRNIFSDAGHFLSVWWVLNNLLKWLFMLAIVMLQQALSILATIASNDVLGINL